MVRVCPKRDIQCPHGDACPYALDRYECRPETAPEEKTMSGLSEEKTEGAPEKWTLQSSIYEGFSTEIWADDRPPGERTIAVVRDYTDAVTILAAHDGALAKTIKELREHNAVWLDRLEAAEARATAAEKERDALTKALTGLTCNGSEFFVRRPDGSYKADIEACVAWVRRSKEDAHKRTVKAISERQAAQSLLAEAVGVLESFYDVAQGITDTVEDEGDRAYFASTNDPDRLRAINRDIEAILPKLRAQQ